MPAREDLKPRDLAAHPVRVLLRHGTLGGPIRASEYDELELSPEHRDRVVKAAADVAALKAGGANQAARARADELAEQIVHDLPHDMQDPDYRSKPDDDGPTDPRGLADQVSRRW
jgi:hypothetical protein